jgi:hypothetical protein
MAKASSADRDYFARIARANQQLPDDRVPASLEEMFDRLEAIRRTHGALARPGVDGSDRGDLDGHLRFLAHVRAVLRHGKKRA